MLHKILSSAVTFYEILTACLIYIRTNLFPRHCQSKVVLSGKTVVITGGNTGIGKATALFLARRGAKVIIGCRDNKRAQDAVRDIKKKVPNAHITSKQLNLASFESIRKFSSSLLKEEPHIHILINNAGVAGSPEVQTEDGVELHFGVNHLGHFLLTRLLLNRMKSSAPSRIVNVTSLCHRLGKMDFDDLLTKGPPSGEFEWVKLYSRSKLANVLFTRELAKRLRGTGVTTYCLHPGGVRSQLWHSFESSWSGLSATFYNYINRLFFLTPEMGAETVVYCAIEKSLAKESGQYYCDCAVLQPSAAARDDRMAERLWNVSENLIKSSNSKLLD